MELCSVFLPVMIMSVVIILLLLQVYLLSRRKHSYWARRGVEQLPRNHWLFGDFKEGILFQAAPAWHLGQIYKRTSADAPFVGFYIFHKPCLLLKDPEIIKQILIRNCDSFVNRSFSGTTQRDSFGMKNLFGLRNQAWRYLRKKITPTLTKSKLMQMLPLMLETCEPMMKYIDKQKGKKGVKIIDAQELSNKYATDLIANVALGTKTDSFNHPDPKFVQEVFENSHCFKRMVSLLLLFFVPDFMDLVGSLLFLSNKFVSRMFWQALEQREKSGEKRGDYIDSILKLKNGEQNPVYRMEGDHLFYQSGAFFAGFESSSIVATFTLMELAKHKNSQERVREEIKTAIQKYDWTYESFTEMKYLDKCISESMRMHPSISMLDRVAQEDYQIPNTDVTVEKGTSIYVSLYGLHGDSKFFEDPEVFNPERFGEDNFVSDAYLPFGTGPRMCIGMKAGLLHVKLAISMILNQYEVRPRFGEHLELDSRFVFTAAARGLHMEFRQLDKGELQTTRPGSL